MKVGIIGGGLMGRETASALARGFALKDPLNAQVVAVADPVEATRDWYKKSPTVTQITPNYQDILANPEIDVVYVAIPHHLHEQIYIDCLRAGKDMLAEKPFGIDLDACERITKRSAQRFVRCSSEFPFYPIVQKAYEIAKQGLGQLIQGRCAFLHSSDLDPNKPINWKRQVATCGEIGVMGDLGMHVCHLPFRLGFEPKTVYAQLQNLIPQRPDGHGGTTECDTWDNATLHTDCGFPFTFETKRIAPGEMNTWEFELIGTEGGVRVSTKHPKTLWTFEVETTWRARLAELTASESPPRSLLAPGTQKWTQTDVGAKTAFETITGEIFEFGFPDAILQMWAAFAAERQGKPGFRCATPEEALQSHRLFAAALESHRTQQVIAL